MLSLLSRRTSLSITSCLPAHSLLTLCPISAQSVSSPAFITWFLSSQRSSFASRTSDVVGRRHIGRGLEHIHGDEFVLRRKFRGTLPQRVPIFCLELKWRGYDFLMFCRDEVLCQLFVCLPKHSLLTLYPLSSQGFVPQPAFLTSIFQLPTLFVCVTHSRMHRGAALHLSRSRAHFRQRIRPSWETSLR